MKRILLHMLCFFAKSIIKKYRPDVIAITGSVGKTTAKETVVRVLSETFSVRGNEKSFNNELGVPLTIIGAHAPGRSVLAWIGVFARAFLLLLWKEKTYPSMLVLEMGADAPGDIEYLVSIAPPKIGVITAIGPTHLEKLGSLERLIEEKKKIFCRHTSSDQWMVLNADDPALQHICHSESLGDTRDKFREETQRPRQSRDPSSLTRDDKPRCMTFGERGAVDLRISDIRERYVFHANEKEYISGIFCTLTFEDESVRVEFPRLVGRHVLSSVIVAAAIGCIYHIPLPEIARRLHHAQPAPGRMRLIPGIKRTLLIDDTYNSSPNAARGAIDTLLSFEIDAGARRIAVLGDMRELGSHAEKEHRALGAYVAGSGVDYLFAVGASAQFLSDGASAAVQGTDAVGLDQSRIFVFTDSQSAGRALQNFMRQGDVILIKGSQNVLRMERIVKEVMHEPLRAKELLVRQEPEWTNNV